MTSETSALGGIDTVISSVTRNLTANLEPGRLPPAAPTPSSTAPAMP
ncbi:MAG: hypothetical protein R3C30_05785 [Hyphomonadaceae bacterium]